MEDSMHHRQLRHNLVTDLGIKGIKDQNVLNAIGKVPRHLFLNDEDHAKEAYDDKPLDIGEGQTISQPFTVAYQTKLLDVHSQQRVLEIGTGSGYQAAVLFEAGAEVYSLERQIKLYTITKTRLSSLGYSGIHLFFKDGMHGLPEFAPFDRILVTAAATEIPAALIAQLKIGGMLVIPMGEAVQKMVRVIKTTENSTEIQEFDDFHFVPLLGGIVET